jgi:hypothetical protein
MKKHIFFLLLLLLGCSACEDLVFTENEKTDKAQDNFEFLWKTANEKYAFFDYKKIDWDAVYRQYKPQIQTGMSQDSLFRVLFRMMNELKDGHVNLISPFNVSKYNFDLLGPTNIDTRIVKEKYLRENVYTTGAFLHNAIANNQVGYVRYSSFSNKVSGFDMAFVFSRYAKTKGLIFDLRQNGGGSIANVFTMLNYLANQRTFLYRSYIKNGPGREDFEGPQDAYAEPTGNIRYAGKVAILVDRGSFSATSFFTLGARELPNVTIIGDSTGGGLGIPNGGQLPNGWTYRFSISRTLTANGENFESGIPPDIRVLLTESDRLKGIDTVIERAVVELLK